MSDFECNPVGTMRLIGDLRGEIRALQLTEQNLRRGLAHLENVREKFGFKTLDQAGFFQDAAGVMWRQLLWHEWRLIAEIPIPEDDRYVLVGNQWDVWAMRRTPGFGVGLTLNERIAPEGRQQPATHWMPLPPYPVAS